MAQLFEVSVCTIIRISAPKTFNALAIAPVIVRDGGRFFLLEEDFLGKRTLNVLRGRIDSNKVHPETAGREAKKETGIEAGMGAPIGVVRRT